MFPSHDAIMWESCFPWIRTINSELCPIACSVVLVFMQSDIWLLKLCVCCIGIQPLLNVERDLWPRLFPKRTVIVTKCVYNFVLNSPNPLMIKTLKALLKSCTCIVDLKQGVFLVCLALCSFLQREQCILGKAAGLSVVQEPWGVCGIQGESELCVRVNALKSVCSCIDFLCSFLWIRSNTWRLQLLLCVNTGAKSSLMRWSDLLITGDVKP